MNYTTEVKGFDVRTDKRTSMVPNTQPTRSRTRVPIWQKNLLSLEEAAEYTGLGLHKLRALSDGEDCDIVLWNGSKRMFKRRRLEEYLEKAYSV